MALKNRNVTKAKQTFQKLSTMVPTLSPTPLFLFLAPFFSSTYFPFTSAAESFQVGSNGHYMTPGSGSEDDQETHILEWAEAWAWLNRLSFYTHCVFLVALGLDLQTLTSHQRTSKAEPASLLFPAPFIVISASSNQVNQIFICCTGNGLKSWDPMGKM